jgi:hypothetical protein
MKKLTFLIILSSLLFLSIPNAWALSIDIEGENTSGGNDTAATSQGIGTLTPNGALTVMGWVDSNNTNDVDFYSFSLNGSLDVYVDIDFANDFGSTEDVDSGLDAWLAVFNEQDQLIAYNDDSDAFDFLVHDPGSLPFGDWDPFIGVLPLGSGTYYATVSSYFNAPNAVLNKTGDPGSGVTQLSVSGLSVSGAQPDSTYDMDGRGSVGQ